MRSFFSELKRRNVLRAAALYVGAAWALAQGLAQLFPAFGVSDWAVRWIVVAAAIGFPFVLIFAWFYEFTPEGLKRESEIDPSDSVTRATGKKLDRWIIAVLTIAVVLLLTDKFVLHKHESAATTAQTSGKSIAVLPFENLSEDNSNSYFATGMQDEILTRLAGIHDLKVISRTSTEQYASHPPNLKIVAEQLGVATVLEGSVQRAGEKVRINLQLIDAGSDSHLWAENYDRDLKDVFAVQSDVSEKVADALKAQLLPAESTRIARVPTNSPEAYDRFLQAEYFARQFEGTSGKDQLETLRKATDLYTSAIAADPAFALAWARRAYVRGYSFWRADDPDPQALEVARTGAVKALELQPDLAEGHWALGAVHYWSRRDYPAALSEFAIAHASLPNDARILASIAFVHRRQGNLVQAVAELQQAAILDPRDTGQPRDLADTFVYLRRYGEALAASNRALALAPDNVEAYIQRAAALQMRGDLDGANRSLAGFAADYDSEGAVSLMRFNIAQWMGKPDAALQAIEIAPPRLLDIINNIQVPAMMLRGQALVAKGEGDAARAAFLAAEESLRMGHESRQAAVQMNLAAVLAGLGQNEAALACARRSTELLPISQDMLDGPFYLAGLARIEAQVGQTELALKHIEQLLALPAGHEISAASLRLDPAWKPLRNDANFQLLVANAEKTESAKW